MITIINLSMTAMIVFYVIATAIFVAILESKKLDYKKAKASFFIFTNLIVSVFVFYCLQNNFNINHLFTCVVIGFGLINLLILWLFKLYKPSHGILFLFLAIFAVYFEYISYTPYWLRQHDSRQFWEYQYGGHFGYIGYIFQNGHLPIENPKDYWCFFNPPLFYLISVGCLQLQNAFGLVMDKCFENLQVLSLLYTIIFDIYVYRILKKVGIKKSLPVVLAFVLFTPALIIMSGSLNNDILSIMLSTMALFYAIKWFETDKLLDLIKVALCISLAMMTKVSTALIAVVIGVLFLVRFIKNRHDFKKYLLHFGIFALIALPIGLWFPIKNWILYQIPPTYVQSIDPDTPINLSKYSTTDRFFKVSSKETLTNVNVIMEEKNTDYNIFFTTLKSFIVDETIEYKDSKILDITVHTLFYLSILISIMSFVNLVYVLIRYKKIQNHWILLFLLLSLLEIGSYLKFCFDFPFPFTMNFRYIVPTLISFSAITGVTSDNNKILFYLNTLLITIFSITSVVMFTNLT
ncbi:MAG: glycosyltransferase family 39 protein [Clostridia bacterium]|nr:glycosyltransferase family 39 protein [Clostridia bacterium]